MGYLVPFSVVGRALGLAGPPFDGEKKISVRQMLDALRMVIRAVPVDEEWYRDTYPDVAAAIEAGSYRSARQHFIENGYLEGRRPSKPVVDADWYLREYPDVAEGIELGDFESAQDHFERHGYAEGRVPTEAELVASSLAI